MAFIIQSRDDGDPRKAQRFKSLHLTLRTVMKVLPTFGVELKVRRAAVTVSWPSTFSHAFTELREQILTDIQILLLKTESVSTASSAYSIVLFWLICSRRLFFFFLAEIITKVIQTTNQITSQCRHGERTVQVWCSTTDRASRCTWETHVAELENIPICWSTVNFTKTRPSLR